MVSLEWSQWSPILSPLIPLMPLATVFFVSSITPGPNNILLMSAGSNKGFRACLGHMLGISLGHAFQVLVVILGLGLIFFRYPSIKILLAVLAAFYLAWMSWGLLQQALQAHRVNPLAPTPAAPPTQSNWAILRHNPKEPMRFMQAALFQWINPKAWSMAITVPGLMPTQWAWPLAVSSSIAVIVAINLPCVAIWAGLGASLRRTLQRVWVAKLFYGFMAFLLGLTALFMFPWGFVLV